MIYFFHHYELPAILQQIRIQEMLLQNQQVGTQTTLQDNLNNNNTTIAPTDPASRQPHLDGGPAGGRGDPLASGEGHAAAIVATAASLGSDLNWVAETAAVITEASFLSDLSTSLLDTGAAEDTVLGGGLQDAAATASSMVTRILVSSDRPEASVGSVTIEVTSTATFPLTSPLPAQEVPAASPLPSAGEDTCQPAGNPEGSASQGEPQDKEHAVGSCSPGSALRRPPSQATEEGLGEAGLCPVPQDSTDPDSHCLS